MVTHHLCFHGCLSRIFKSSGRGMKSGAGAGGTELSCTHNRASESLQSFLNNLNLSYAGKSPTLAPKHGLNVGCPHREANGALAPAVVEWREKGVVASHSQHRCWNSGQKRGKRGWKGISHIWVETVPSVASVMPRWGVQRHQEHRHGFGSTGHNR